MQGRRSVVGSLPDTLGFDHGSTPSDVTGLDQQIRWSNMQNSSHNHLPEYSPSNASNRLMNSTTGVEQNLSGWNLDEPSPILDERQFAAPNNFSHSSASVNLSSNQILNGPLFPQSSISDSIHQDLNISSGFAGHNTYKSSSSQNVRLPTSNTADPFLLPSGSNGYVVEENDAMRGCKRKAHEGNVGPSSSSPNYYHRAEPSLTGEPNQGLRLGVGGVSSASGESSRRNLRMRINPPHQQELPPVHTFSTGITVNNSLNLRSPSPSPSPADNTSLHENLVRTPTQQHSQQSARWNRNFISSPSSSNVANPREESTLSSGVHPSSAAAPPNRIPHRNHPRYQRRLVEIIRRSLANSTGGEYVNSQGSGTPASMPEMSPSSVEQGHHLSQSRSAVPLNGQVDGAFGSMRSLPSSTGGRNRLMSEHIRNILDLMRRGEGLRFEDVMILDQAVFFGMANIHDQHRDMRLDVDNMSYEELLALEDRIGNVNTGLSEETILTRLKRRKCLTSTTTDQLEVEPCCICQEEYKCGEDLGMLECGHDFHSDCIKQWLKQKNLCPICKTTALIT